MDKSVESEENTETDNFWNGIQDSWLELINNGTIGKAIIEQNFEIAKNLENMAEEHRKNLEAKAKLLINLLVWITPVSTGIYGFLLERLRIPISATFVYSLIILTIGFIFLIGVAGSIYMSAIRPVSGYCIINRKDAFETQVGFDENDTPERREMKYRLYLSIHFWKIFEKNYETNEKKGTEIKKGYDLFFIGFAGMITSILLLLMCLLP